MGVKAREFDREMQGSGVLVTHAGAQVLGQMAGPWAYPFCSTGGWSQEAAIPPASQTGSTGKEEGRPTPKKV